MKERSIQEIEDLTQTELRLHEPIVPAYKLLTVFIRDPQDPQLYCCRIISVVSCKLNLKFDSSGNSSIYNFDIKIQKQGAKKLDNLLYLESEVGDVITQMIKRESSFEKNYKIDKLQANIGIAEYKGTKSFSLDDITLFVGIKYYLLRTAYSN